MNAYNYAINANINPVVIDGFITGFSQMPLLTQFANTEVGKYVDILARGGYDLPAPFSELEEWLGDLGFMEAVVARVFLAASIRVPGMPVEAGEDFSVFTEHFFAELPGGVAAFEEMYKISYSSMREKIGELRGELSAS